MEAWTSEIYNLEELLSLLVQYLTGKRVTFNARESLIPPPQMNMRSSEMALRVARFLNFEETIDIISKEALCKSGANIAGRHPSIHQPCERG
jgi:hypothetical protein